MNEHHHHHHHHYHRQQRPPQRTGCLISRMVGALSRRLGVHRHAGIAGFVLGFVFAPMLTLPVLLAALYWTKHPERMERQLNGVVEKARSTYRSYVRTAPETNDPPPREKDQPVPDFPELRRRFEALEARTQTMESCVASDEFNLNRQFKGLSS